MDIEKIKKYTKTPIYYYKEINSTHVYGKQIEGQGDAILIAEAQTAGIGTKGRNWYKYTKRERKARETKGNG